MVLVYGMKLLKLRMNRKITNKNEFLTLKTVELNKRATKFDLITHKKNYNYT